MKLLLKILRKLSFSNYRKVITDNQTELIIEIKNLQAQFFLKHPYLVVGRVQMYLPLFYVDHIQSIIFKTRDFYEIETLNFLKQQFGEFKSVIDIGTNIGNHMLFWVSEMKADKVYCFEPNEFNRKTLVHNVELNSLDAKVDVYNCALGSGSGKGIQRDFSVSNTGMNRIEFLEDQICLEKDIVNIESLDSFNIRHVDFVKIDVEGFELEVLGGAIDTIHRCKPTILIEVFDENLSIVDSFMEKNGYQKFATIENFNVIYYPIQSY